MGSKYKVPYQNLEYDIPDDDEVFFLDDRGYRLGVRKGSQILTIDLADKNALNSKYLQSVDRNKGKFTFNVDGNISTTDNPTGDYLTLSLKALRDQGINVGANLNEAMRNFKYYNPGDVNQAFTSFGGSVSSASDAAVFKSTPKTTGEVITRSISPKNQHESVIESSISGTLKAAEAPSALAQQAAAEGKQVAFDPTKAEQYGKDANTFNQTVEQPKPFSETDPSRVINDTTGQTAATLVPQQQPTQPQQATVAGPSAGTDADIQVLMSNPSVAVSGNYARLPNGSIIDTRTSQVVQTGAPTIQGPAPATTTPAQTSPPQPQINPEANAQLQALLSNPNLTPDQRAALQSIYTAITTNDLDYAGRLKAAIGAATQYSDPFFKAQTRLVTDALERGLKAEDDDLAFNEEQKRNTLKALLQDIEASKDSLSLDEQQQLRTLTRQLQTDMEATRDDLAARGFTTSSVRARKEQLVNDTYGDLRQSAQRSLTEKTTALTNQGTRAQTSTVAEIARLQELARSGKLDKLRTAEESVGSNALSSLGYGNLLGGVGGALPRAQAQDALSFASGFVF